MSPAGRDPLGDPPVSVLPGGCEPRQLGGTGAGLLTAQKTIVIRTSAIDMSVRPGRNTRRRTWPAIPGSRCDTCVVVRRSPLHPLPRAPAPRAPKALLICTHPSWLPIRITPREEAGTIAHLSPHDPRGGGGYRNSAWVRGLDHGDTARACGPGDVSTMTSGVQQVTGCPDPGVVAVTVGDSDTRATPRRRAPRTAMLRTRRADPALRLDHLPRVSGVEPGDRHLLGDQRRR